MPVYEYRCTECGERTQRLQDVGEDSSGRVCHTCGKGTLRKVFSVFGTTPGRGQGFSCAPPGDARGT